MKLLALVKFSPRGRVLAYVASDLTLQSGDDVLAETGQGFAMGRIVGLKSIEDSDIPEGMLGIDHRATPEELSKDAENRRFLDQAFRFCVDSIHRLHLDMKLVDVESLFDRSKLLFTFTAPTRVDFRDLVKELVREFHTRIELRQVGVRHETQMLGAMGPCGMACCCRRYMRDFAPVTIKMAKEQNLFLNPTKISGICGRLLCCLSFEQGNYEQFNRSCPRLGKRYTTTAGTLKVLRANMFRNSVNVLDEAGEEHEYTLDEWKALSPTRPETPAPQDGKHEQVTRRPPVSDMMVVEADPDMDDAALDRSFEDAFASFEGDAVGPLPETRPAGHPNKKRNRRPTAGRRPGKPGRHE